MQEMEHVEQPGEVINQTPHIHDSHLESQNTNKATQKNNKFLKILAAIAAVFVLIGGLILYKNFFTRNFSDPVEVPITLPDQKPPATSVDVEELGAVQTEMSSFLSTSYVSIGVPEGWKVSISNKGAISLTARAFPPNEEITTTYAEIQVVRPDTEVVVNPNLEFTTSQTVGDITIRQGKENFLNSSRVVMEVSRKEEYTYISVILYAPDEMTLKQYKQTLIDMIRSNQNNTNSGLLPFVSQVYAQAQPSIYPITFPATIAGIPISKATPLEVMGGPYPERITSSDQPYDGGYAKLYSFEYIPGQRIEALVEENNEDRTAIGSFIATELWGMNDENVFVKLLDMGTRLDLTKQNLSVGTYYIVAKTFDNKEGRILIKIFDLDQVTDLFYAKYADGSEHLLNGNSGVSFNQEAVLLVRFVSPIEVVGLNSVRWYRKVDNACIDCYPDGGYAGVTAPPGYGDVTVPFFITVNGIDNPIKITKVFSNQAIVQPENGGGFPINSNMRFSLNFGSLPNGGSLGYTGTFSTF